MIIELKNLLDVLSIHMIAVKRMAQKLDRENSARVARDALRSAKLEYCLMDEEAFRAIAEELDPTTWPPDES